MDRLIKVKAFKYAIITVFWLGVWQLAASLIDSPLMLPSPVDTVKALVALLGDKVLYMSAGMTLLRVIAGFLCGLLVGTALGVLCVLSDFVNALLRPIRSIITSTPVTSFIILVLLWLTASATPVFIAFLMVMPIFWTNVYEGISNTDKQLVEMGRVFGLSKMRMLRDIYIPSMLPYFVSACSTGLGFAWKSGVAAEVIAASANSIGGKLYESKLYLETPDLFAWTAVVILLSVVLERSLMKLIKGIRIWK